MSRIRLLVAISALLPLALGAMQRSYHWQLPKGFPPPYVPSDNPMTDAKVLLGRYLFYDPKLSVNGNTSCATCHQQRLAFTDGKTVAQGTTGELHPRNAMSLVNVAYSAALTWNNPNMTRLEDQALVPMLGTHPVELGMRKGDKFLPYLQGSKVYQSLFAKAAIPCSIDGVTKAIACFERSIVSADSPYDRYHFGGDDNAVSAAVKHGEELFFSEKCACFHCHGGFNFSDATFSARSPRRAVEFHNNGLYNVSGPTSYPTPNLGIYEYTHRPEDIGKFKAPTLRNIALTGPYMHDGSIATLGEVIDHYAAGGRTLVAGPHAGNGSKNPNKDGRIGGFPLSAVDKANLLAFLESLTDQSVTHDPRFANPWIHQALNQKD